MYICIEKYNNIAIESGNNEFNSNSRTDLLTFLNSSSNFISLPGHMLASEETLLHAN